MSRKLDILKNETVENMVDSLFYQSKLHNKALMGITIDNFNWFLDDLFRDGGEIRCEKFTDLATEYALQFGEIESTPFTDKQWSCIESAIKKINKRID